MKCKDYNQKFLRFLFDFLDATQTTEWSTGDRTIRFVRFLIICFLKLFIVKTFFYKINYLVHILDMFSFNSQTKYSVCQNKKLTYLIWSLKITFWKISLTNIKVSTLILDIFRVKKIIFRESKLSLNTFRESKQLGAFFWSGFPSFTDMFPTDFWRFRRNGWTIGCQATEEDPI